jgi:L-cysteine desulfidase
LKQNLIGEVQEALLIETLQCKPIRGIDMPMMLGAGAGAGGLSSGQKIIQVDDIEGHMPEPALPSDILSSLMPT